MGAQEVQTIDREEVARRLLDIGRQTLDLERIEAEMEEAINAVKAQYAHRLETRRYTLERSTHELEDLCNEARPSLVARGKKSLKTLYGVIKWRLTPDKIGHLKGMDWDRVTQALVDRRHPDLVRIRKEPAKDLVKEALQAGRIDDAELRACGLVVRLGEERWGYDLDRPKILEQLGPE